MVTGTVWHEAQQGGHLSRQSRVRRVATVRVRGAVAPRHGAAELLHAAVTGALGRPAAACGGSPGQSAAASTRRITAADGALCTRLDHFSSMASEQLACRWQSSGMLSRTNISMRVETFCNASDCLSVLFQMRSVMSEYQFRACTSAEAVNPPACTTQPSYIVHIIRHVLVETLARAALSGAAVRSRRPSSGGGGMGVPR